MAIFKDLNAQITFFTIIVPSPTPIKDPLSKVWIRIPPNSRRNDSLCQSLWILTV